MYVRQILLESYGAAIFYHFCRYQPSSDPTVPGDGQPATVQPRQQNKRLQQTQAQVDEVSGKNFNIAELFNRFHS